MYNMLWYFIFLLCEEKIKKAIISSIIENFFVMNETKYHELYYVFRIKLGDNNIITKQNNLRGEKA